MMDTVREDPRDLEPSCDGVHDEGAPPHHLCTRCYPDLIDRALGGDLSEGGDDEYGDVCRDEHEEME